jgi:hypothetical protein
MTHERIFESWNMLDYVFAKSLRDRRARELRKQGYLVQIETEDGVYSLWAEHE